MGPLEMAARGRAHAKYDAHGAECHRAVGQRGVDGDSPDGMEYAHGHRDGEVA